MGVTPNTHGGVLAAGIALVVAAALSAPEAQALSFGPPKAAIHADPQALQIVKRAIEAHGGMAAWHKKKDVIFFLSLIQYDDQGKQIERSVGRHHYLLQQRGLARVESLGETLRIVQVTTPQEAWVTVGGVLTYDPTLVKMAQFSPMAERYWFELPFNLLEPGASLNFMGLEAAPDGKRTYQKVRVVYGVNPMESPGTWYVFYFDVATGLLAKTHFVVQHEPFAGQMLMGHWKDYERVNGIHIPRRRLFYPADATGAEGPQLLLEEIVEDLTFNRGIHPRLFQRPPEPEGSLTPSE